MCNLNRIHEWLDAHRPYVTVSSEQTSHIVSIRAASFSSQRQYCDSLVELFKAVVLSPGTTVLNYDEDPSDSPEVGGCWLPLPGESDHWIVQAELNWGLLARWLRLGGWILYHSSHSPLNKGWAVPWYDSQAVILAMRQNHVDCSLFSFFDNQELTMYLAEP
jgi:hypothetical protein